ncbi:hypothetical protein [Streptomyces sp. TLI_105]|uniref:hypothetical protein n=1 Tax=Streptomyces sp. TLI_105 TaxID=1881019 RepID=UPI000894BAE9|nr:hypothetical protein [Streptomyces sp. TLI_105]SED99796.1 hypothetical protein SAMN05428939_6993 [Streptomyces sp. TLI_105]
MRHPLSVTAARSLLAAVLTASAAAAAVTPAAAEVLVDDFDVTRTDTFTVPLEGCLPADLLGTATVTEHSIGRVVQTPGAVVVKGVDLFDFRMTFPDGRYVDSGVDQERFTAVFTEPRRIAVASIDSRDERTLHAPDGTPIGTLSIRETYDVVYRDTNGNGEPDPGEITTERHRFRLTCG